LAAGETDNTIDFGFCACSGVTASAVDLGPACNLPLDPVLTSTLPILGTTMVISLNSQFPDSLGFFFASLPPVQAYAVPGIGCNIYVDVFNPQNFFLITMFFTDSNGTWNLPIPLPAIPQLEGLELYFQVRLCSPTGPAGPLSPDWLSNGLGVRAGCP
jgi:hypothetical protein